MLSPCEKEKKKFLETFDDSDSWNTPEKQVPWFGQFEQDGVWHSLRIFNLQIEQGGPITGSGADESGQFIIQGQVAYPDEVYFVKSYRTGQTVKYNGNINEGFIEGTWHRDLSTFNGKFYLSMAVPPKWEGWLTHTHSEEKKQLIFNMYVDYDGVYGVGSDEVGQYVIKGVMDSRCIKFVQCYHDCQEVRFLGHLEYVGNEKIIIGRFGRNEVEGNFEMNLIISDSKAEIYGAAAYMKKAQDLVMGGPLSRHSRETVSQTRLSGYTGPELDASYFTSITTGGWVLHPGKCRFDYITQNGQGSLKGHSMNINVPSKPAWGHLTLAQKRNHPGLPDENNTSNQYHGTSMILSSFLEKPIKIPSDSTQVGELCTTSNGEQGQFRNHCPPRDAFTRIPTYDVDSTNTSTATSREIDPSTHYSLQGTHSLPMANHYLIDMVHRK